MKYITLAAAIIVLTIACCRLFRSRESAFRVEPPFRGADVPYTEHRFSNDTAIDVHSHTGTRIHIPANALEWADGSPAKGTLTLRYREFHDAWGILRAGIPMEVAGTDGRLRSAGMIDIRIGQDGRQARLRNNAGIDIQLAAYQRAEGFDLYYLSNDSAWTVVDTFATKDNRRKAERLAALEGQSPDPGRFNPGSNSFRIEADTNELPYMKPLDGLLWKVDRRDANADFRRARRIKWDKVDVTRLEGPGNRFRLDFKRYLYVAQGDARKLEYSVVATPTRGGRGGEAAAIDRQLARYDSAYADWRRVYGRVAAEADLVNSFRINRLGIWNIDILMKKEYLVNREVRFDFEASRELQDKDILVYAVYRSDNSVLPYRRWETKEVGIPQDGEVDFIAVINDSTFAYVPDTTLRNALATGGDILLPSKRRRAEELPKFSGR
jgi:hypothetical protein